MESCCGWSTNPPPRCWNPALPFPSTLQPPDRQGRFDDGAYMGSRLPQFFSYPSLFPGIIVNPQDTRFWQQIILPSKPGEVLPIVAVFVGLAAIVIISRPKERGEVRTAGGLFGLSLALLLASNAWYWFGMP